MQFLSQNAPALVMSARGVMIGEKINATIFVTRDIFRSLAFTIFLINNRIEFANKENDKATNMPIHKPPILVSLTIKAIIKMFIQ